MDSWAGLLATGAAGAILVRIYDIRADRARARRQFIAALRIVREECAANATAINLARAAARETRLVDDGFRQVATVLMQPAEPTGPQADLWKLIGGSVPELNSTLRKEVLRAYRDIHPAVLERKLPSNENLPAGSQETENLLQRIATGLGEQLKELGAGDPA
jgi:hypothetical protein